MKRQISLFLAMILITQPITVLSSENTNSSDVLLTVDAQVFSAVVPTQLPVWMSASGVITVAEDVSITNTSNGPIRIDNIEIANVKADWKLSNFADDFSTFRVGSKNLAMSFNGDNSLASGNITLGAINLAPIDGLGSMPLNYDAKIPAQSTGLVNEIPANVVFTLKWYEVGSANIEENNPNEYEFVPADTKVLTINFKGVTADNDTVTWSSSDEAVATVADHVNKGRARPIDGSKQCMVTAMGSGKAIISGTLQDGTTNSFEVVVANKSVVSIDVTKVPDKVAYIEGENFSSAGMIVTANYNNGTSSDISDYVIIDRTNLDVGQDSITIRYNSKTTSQNISVVSKRLTSIVIITSPTKTAYIEGDDFDATGMVVTANYDNGTTEVIIPMLSNHTNLFVGQAGVNVSYGGKTVTQAITVSAKTLTSIEITSPPTKANYIEANDFDATGIILTANYNNGTTGIVVPTFARHTKLIVGQTSVDVSYGGKTVFQAITVVAKTLTSIAVTTLPNKTNYVETNNFDATGMIVTAYYDNSTSGAVFPVFGRNTNLVTGQTSVDVSYGGKTIAQAITVTAKTLTSIEITTPPNKISYIEANNFDSTGIVVTATYNNGLTATVTPTFARHTNLTTGQTSVDVSFGGKTVTQAIIVASKMLTSIAVTTQPTKKTYIEGNSFDVTGMAVTAYYNNGTSNTISPTLSRNTNLTMGQTSVDISFGGKTVSQAITVSAKTLTSIAITTAPSQTSYIEANNFNSTGMVVTAYYNNETNGIITPIFSRNTNLTVGQTSVDVNFGGMTVAQSITVVAKTLTSIAITTQPNKKSYIEANNFDSTGMIVTANYNNGTTGIVVPTFARHTNLTTGQTSVDVSFGGKTVTQAITVSAKTLTSIAITTQSNKKAYIEANNFDATGMVVTAYYNNGSNGIITPTFGRHTSLTTGQTTIDVNFGGKTVTQNITVATKTLTTIAITTQPNKKTYIEANNFDATGMVVRATYNNGTTANVTPTFGRHINLTIGQTTVDVSFGGKMVTQAITVATKTLTNIAITTPPTKKTYVETSSFDKLGMVVTATYNNGTTAIVTPTFGRHTNLVVGQTSIDVSFGGKTITQAITVVGKVVVGTKYTQGNYEYSFGQSFENTNKWTTIDGQNGWGVRVIDKSQTDYISPLTIIQEQPVTNMTCLFYMGSSTTINLINWNTSSVTNMKHMFYSSSATTINGLNGFDTSNVTNMFVMFNSSKATSLNVSSFNTSKVTNMGGMFSYNQAVYLDLSSFDLSNVTNVNQMFQMSKVRTLIARTQSDASKYQTSTQFPKGVTVTIKA